jgi:hypothetical protein
MRNQCRGRQVVNGTDRQQDQSNICRPSCPYAGAHTGRLHVSPKIRSVPGSPRELTPTNLDFARSARSGIVCCRREVQQRARLRERAGLSSRYFRWNRAAMAARSHRQDDSAPPWDSQLQRSICCHCSSSMTSCEGTRQAEPPVRGADVSQFEAIERPIDITRLPMSHVRAPASSNTVVERSRKRTVIS